MLPSIPAGRGPIVSANRPCVLLVEDDAVARAFLAEVLGRLAVRLVVAGSVDEALGQAPSLAGEPVALALLDLQLPDGDGAGLLGSLRAGHHVRRAVALTADAAAVLDARLQAAGFDAVAHKPVSRGGLMAVVEQFVPALRGGGTTDWRASEVRDGAVAANGGSYGPCGTSGGGEAALFDEEAALVAANARADIVASLRGLLVADLEQQRAAVRQALRVGDTTGARAVLHRMVAACGFCAAVRLQRAVLALDAVLAAGEDHASEWQAFDAACTATRAAAATRL